jgi:hypothetical protein
MSDMATHVAEYINDVTKYNISTNIIAHSKTFGYPLYMLKDFDTKENDSIAILRSDWNTYIAIKSFVNIKTAFLYDNDKMVGEDCYDFCALSDDILENIQNYENTSNFNTFIFQKFLCPDKNFKVIKQLEFEIGYQLICKLNDLVVFKHQENIMNYHADFLLELKNNLNRDIPSIVVEINEDDHKTYSKENEKCRKQVLEAFGNRVISIPVNRTATQKDIKNIVDKFAKQIRQLCQDLIIEYSPEIKDDNFIHLVEEHNIEKSFIQLFFKESENKNSIFKYSHQEVGKFLGYSNLKNYDEFRNLIIKNFIKEKDYIILDEVGCGVVPPPPINKGSLKKTYFVSRKTFNLICIRSNKPRAKQCAEYFATVYDIALEYVQRLRAKNIKNEVEIKPKLEKVTERVDDLVEQRVSKYKVVKVEKENNELRDKIKELENMIKQKEEIICEKDRAWKSSISRAELLLKDVNDLQYKIEKLEKDNVKLLKELRENKKIDKVDKVMVKVDGDVIEKCKMYFNKLLITHLKNFCKEIGGISGYTSYKKDDKDKLENLIIKYMDKNKDFFNKVIKYLETKKVI